MTRFKKMTAVLLSVVMFVCMFTVPASAKSIFDDAITIKPMETVSHTFKNDTEILYKIVLSSPGSITFYCSDYSGSQDIGWEVTGPSITVIDTNGNTVLNGGFLYKNINSPQTIEKKGTYYIKFVKRPTETHFKNFYYGFKPDETPTLSLAVNVKVGDTLDFSALSTNYSGKVTWKTTKSSVATVEKGTVTAKKAGTAKIRAYMDNGDYAEIVVKVKKK